MSLLPGSVSANGSWSPAGQDSLAKRMEDKLVAHDVITVAADSADDPGRIQRRHFLVALSEAIVEHFQEHGEVVFPVPSHDVTCAVTIHNAGGGGLHSHTADCAVTVDHHASGEVR